MVAKRPFKIKLRDICQVTGAEWAVWIKYDDGAWSVLSFSQKTSIRKKIEILLNQPEFSHWLTKAQANPKVRQRQNLIADEYYGSTLFLFPGQDEKLTAILVAANILSTQSEYLWHMAVEVLIGRLREEEYLASQQNALMELENTQQELQARVAAQQAAEARLIQTTKLAAVGEMAAGVAHELNNPLTTVVGFSGLVLESLPLDSPQRADLETVLKESKRARDVVRRLLDFSRQSETIRVKADVNEVVSDVLSLMQHMFHINGVEIHTRFEDGLPWAMIDRNQMKQVFLNLLNNALNAMSEGGELEVRTFLETRRGLLHVGVSIKDTGAGIPPENLSRIFEPFFTTRAGQGGTGLGLSVTYGIVSEHGGSIEVESETGRGSVFTVFLPIEDKS